MDFSVFTGLIYVLTVILFLREYGIRIHSQKQNNRLTKSDHMDLQSMKSFNAYLTKIASCMY